MIIENSFVVPLPPEETLDILTDVPRIAPCIPGVALTETVGDGAYKGTAAVRLGPVALVFGGAARIVEIDRSARTARVEAEGADQKGRGRARASVTFRLSLEGAGTRVDVASDVTLTGQVAQYGRASGLINEVARQIIGEFAHNLESMLSTAPAGTGPAEAATEQPAPRKQEISGIGLLVKAILAIIARLFARSEKP